MDTKQRVQNPVTVTNSIVAAKYDQGILVLSDLSVSYGKCYKFSNVSHMKQLTPTILIGGTGELGDFQELAEFVEQEMQAFEARTGGESLTVKEVFNYIKRIMYQKRSKMNPSVCRVLCAGINPDKTLFLGCVDLYGTSWEDDYIYTGIAQHIHANQVSDAAGKDRKTVYDAMHQIAQALYARHSTMIGKLELFDIRADGTTRTIEDAVSPNWDIIED